MIPLEHVFHVTRKLWRISEIVFYLTGLVVVVHRGLLFICMSVKEILREKIRFLLLTTYLCCLIQKSAVPKAKIPFPIDVQSLHVHWWWWAAVMVILVGLCCCVCLFMAFYNENIQCTFFFHSI